MDLPRLRHSWCLDLVGIPATYRRATGRGIRVAVLDTGIDLGHPDFRGRVEEGTTAVSFVAGARVQDGHGHGTHCAGIIAGPAIPAGRRRYGVAPDVELLVARVLTDAGAGQDDGILEAMDWAVDQGARVISLSMGSVRGTVGSFSPLYERVARDFLQCHPGTLVLGAAGNTSSRPRAVMPLESPAACPSILAVAAVDRALHVASFNCGGMDQAPINLVGPGVDVYSSWTGGGYALSDGTSMAAPHVAGVAALYLELEPSLTAEQLWQRLESHALPLGRQEDCGAGLVQAP